jgi:tetratricopeptide (TPR) repeat protein
MSGAEQDFESAQQFDALKNRWQRAIDAGQLEEAEELIEQACRWARAHGDDRRVDGAVCAHAAVAIQLGRGERELPRLREILLRSSDPANCRLAAYHISLHYELTKNFKKSLFYARIAFDRAVHLGRKDWLAASRNQLGNALLGESFVDQACREYRQALELISAEPSVWRAQILHNLGYCHILEGKYKEGYTRLYECLAILRRLKVERYQVSPRLDLCFAHLETGRYRHARRQATLALALAEKTGQVEATKNALYLLGEAVNLEGDTARARQHFTRLQRQFFPNADYLPGFLLAVDVRKMINLHA